MVRALDDPPPPFSLGGLQEQRYQAVSLKRIPSLLIAVTLLGVSAQGVLARQYPWSGGRPVTVTVDLERPVAEISPRHFGHNFAWWNHSSWLGRNQIARRVEAGGFKFLRFPGGSSSDEYFWDLEYEPFDQWAGRHEPRGGGPFPIPRRRDLKVDLSGGKLGLAAASVTGVRVELE